MKKTGKKEEREKKHTIGKQFDLQYNPNKEPSTDAQVQRACHDYLLSGCKLISDVEQQSG